ncbi:hypothetical protein EZS27_006129 [termite gut metagenome]|uniref:NAD(P)-binding domain-containing protein n=1 Tax=termite gut metagenome TaxID=433724 RepID=A0A5J4SLS1_9ZZZZ
MGIQKTAIILGATGLTGSLLLKRLIKDDRYINIKLFSRRATEITSPKVNEYIVDLLNLEQFKDQFTGDEVFCCIGTTTAKTSDKNLYRAIDFGIPSVAAKLAKENGIHTFMVVSAIGANINSSIFYNKTKGEMEQDVLGQAIQNTYILRPSLILGDRGEKRLGEKIASLFMKLTNPLIVGKFRKYRSIQADCIAATMINLTQSGLDEQILESDIIQKLCSEK